MGIKKDHSHWWQWEKKGLPIINFQANVSLKHGVINKSYTQNPAMDRKRWGTFGGKVIVILLHMYDFGKITFQQTHDIIS